MKTAKPSSPVAITLNELMALRATPAVGGGPNTAAKAMLSGGHRSRFRGRGMEFAEVRAYQPGDDVRAIDWRVTARRGKVHTKLFHEEREQPVLFALDYRRPMFFATRGCFKAVLGSQLAAILAWNALARGDRVGGFLFSEEDRTELRPLGGHRGVLRLLRAMVANSSWQRPVHQPFEPRQRLAETVQRLLRVVRPGSQVHLFSDFTQWDEAVERHLAVLTRQAEVVLYFVYDPLEVDLPQGGNYRLSDGRSDLTIVTDRHLVRQEYHQHFTSKKQRIDQFCKSYRIRLVMAQTDVDPLQVLMPKGGTDAR